MNKDKTNLHEVYVHISDTGDIIAPPNSSAFLTDLTGWTKIDEGRGDRYHLAQAHYFDKPYQTRGGAFRYRLVDGKVEEKPNDEIAQEEATLVAARKKQEQIEGLKLQLSDSDYKIIKCMECSIAGVETPYDITTLHNERQAIRDQINALESSENK